jgi:hypothetical protein
MNAGLLSSDGSIIWKNALDLDSIHAWNVALQALVPRYPGPASVTDCEESVEDLRGTIGNRVAVALQFEEVLAVGAAALQELVVSTHDGAYHACAHVALLVGRNPRHDVGFRRSDVADLFRVAIGSGNGASNKRDKFGLPGTAWV